MARSGGFACAASPQPELLTAMSWFQWPRAYWQSFSAQACSMHGGTCMFSLWQLKIVAEYSDYEGMRPKGSPETLEWRRQRAVELLEAGKTPAEVAEFLDVDRNTVYRWRRWYRRTGRQGITARPIPGRPPRLRPDQQEVLIQCLQQGAREHGYATDRWTQERVAALIQALFGVTFCPFHVGRLLAANGWRPPKTKRPGRRTGRAEHSLR
jgi:transposase